MALPPMPLARYLVPAGDPALPPSFARLDIALDQGLPYAFALGAGWSATLRLATGSARLWLDADAASVATSDDGERAPSANAPVALPPARLTVRRGAGVAVLPLVAGRRVLVVDDGTGPAALELAILSWTIAAGTVRGTGAYGSVLSLAWRDATPAVDAFATPPVPAAVAERLAPQFAQPVAVLQSRPAVLLDREIVALDPLPPRRLVRWL